MMVAQAVAQLPLPPMRRDEVPYFPHGRLRWGRGKAKGVQVRRPPWNRFQQKQQEGGRSAASLAHAGSDQLHGQEASGRRQGVHVAMQAARPSSLVGRTTQSDLRVELAVAQRHVKLGTDRTVGQGGRRLPVPVLAHSVPCLSVLLPQDPFLISLLLDVRVLLSHGAVVLPVSCSHQRLTVYPGPVGHRHSHQRLRQSWSSELDLRWAPQALPSDWVQKRNGRSPPPPPTKCPSMMRALEMQQSSREYFASCRGRTCPHRRTQALSQLRERKLLSHQMGPGEE